MNVDLSLINSARALFRRGNCPCCIRALCHTEEQLKHTRPFLSHQRTASLMSGMHRSQGCRLCSTFVAICLCVTFVSSLYSSSCFVLLCCATRCQGMRPWKYSSSTWNRMQFCGVAKSVFIVDRVWQHHAHIHGHDLACGREGSAYIATRRCPSFQDLYTMPYIRVSVLLVCVLFDVLLPIVILTTCARQHRSRQCRCRSFQRFVLLMVTNASV